MRMWLPAVTLGLALGGFFDGVLLHQILQWHHLFSLVLGMDDLRMQILWDGYLHAAMYAIGLIGLAAVWRHRAVISEDPRRRLWAMLPVGFGLWHAIDAVLSHLVLKRFGFNLIHTLRRVSNTSTPGVRTCCRCCRGL